MHPAKDLRVDTGTATSQAWLEAKIQSDIRQQWVPVLRRRAQKQQDDVEGKRRPAGGMKDAVAKLIGGAAYKAEDPPTTAPGCCGVAPQGRRIAASGCCGVMPQRQAAPSMEGTGPITALGRGVVPHLPRPTASGRCGVMPQEQAAQMEGVVPHTALGHGVVPHFPGLPHQSSRA